MLINGSTARVVDANAKLLCSVRNDYSFGAGETWINWIEDIYTDSRAMINVEQTIATTSHWPGSQCPRPPSAASVSRKVAQNAARIRRTGERERLRSVRDRHVQAPPRVR